MTSFKDYGIEIPRGEFGHARTTCPQCSHTRRNKNDKCLSVETTRGVWICHHCGWTGSLRKGIEVQPEPVRTKIETGLPDKVLKWFDSRGIPPDVLKKNKIGYKNKEIQFPYFVYDDIVNIKHRTGDKRFRQEKGAKKTVYGYNDIKGFKRFIITEGEMDKLSYDVIGEPACSVPDGAPPVNAQAYHSKFDYLGDIENELQEATTVILSTDSDAPGYKLREELARRIGLHKCKIVEYPPDCKDANDVLVKYGKGKLETVIREAVPYPVEGIYTANDIRTDIIRLYEDGPEPAHKTGWDVLDEFFKVRLGEVTTVIGIPSHGKSAFVEALLGNLSVLHGWRHAVFLPEHLPIRRQVASLAQTYMGRSFDTKYRHHMTREEMDEGLSWVSEHFYHIMPEDDAALDDILERFKYCVLRYGVNTVVIDPYNELDDPIPSGMTESRYISTQYKKIRKFARSHHVHVIVVVHPFKLIASKSGEPEPVPTLYHASGSAAFRNRTDNGISVYRELHSSAVDLHIQKIKFREVGKTGKVTLYFDMRTGQYHEIPQDYAETPSRKIVKRSAGVKPEDIMNRVEADNGAGF